MDVISLLKKHASIRKFTDEKISESLLKDIVSAGQSAATSSFLQGVTLIRVTERGKREKLVELTGNQAYVATAAEFLVCCADLNRARLCCELHQSEMNSGWVEQFIIATVDVALMAQNMVVAAESEGLGICYIGGIRNNPQKVSELLKLPDLVYPVFGLCLGYPAQNPEAKPRLPLSVVLKENNYEQDDLNIIKEYDEKVREYYKMRTSGKKDMTWSEQMSGLLSKESRPHMLNFLNSRGLAKK